MLNFGGCQANSTLLPDYALFSYVSGPVLIIDNITYSPDFVDWVSSLFRCIKLLLLAKILGWLIACNWKLNMVKTSMELL